MYFVVNTIPQERAQTIGKLSMSWSSSDLISRQSHGSGLFDSPLYSEIASAGSHPIVRFHWRTEATSKNEGVFTW